MIDIKITDVRPGLGDSGFLIDDGKTAILYDTGYAFRGEELLNNVKRELGERELDYIFLTHSHYDHALGAPYVLRHYKNAKVVAGAYAKTIFDKPTARAKMRELDRKYAAACGVTEYEDLVDNLRVDIAVSDGDVVKCGDLSFTAVNLPGHTKCSVGFYLAENKLLLATETLGAYFGEDTYLPLFLVGFKMTMDSFEKAKALKPESILVPHYGLIEKGALAYLEASQAMSRKTALDIKAQLLAGRTEDEAIAYFKELVYHGKVKDAYPIDAFNLNTGIMVGLIKRELLEE